MELKNLNILVAGMERSGIASVEFLVKRGARVTAVDARPLEQLSDAARALSARGIAFRLQKSGGFEDFDGVVLSPGVPFDAPEVKVARDRGVPVIGELELAAPYLAGQTIGITGSNGKTTTTALTGHILAECGVPVQVGGNIGTAVTAMVDTSKDGQWNVLELSSFQLESTVSFRPNIAVILNITQNHLDRHGTMDAYADAKGHILDHQVETDYAVLNADDKYCRSFENRGPAKRVWFSGTRKLSRGAYLDGGIIWMNGEPVLPAAELLIRGRHNWENAMAAMEAAHLIGIPLPDIARAVRTFQAVEHRLEFVRNVGGIDFYNDSKATSVDATLKALDAFESGVWVILGGKDKGSDYTPLRTPLAKKARAALLIGSASAKIASHLEGAVELIDAGTLDSAVRTAYEKACPGDTILLAPACASFDQFQSYEYRGRVFKDLVRNLENREHGTTA
jgi:UDP-N-acetylmuramoylalanine--D-glutamate ligase